MLIDNTFEIMPVLVGINLGKAKSLMRYIAMLKDREEAVVFHSKILSRVYNIDDEDLRMLSKLTKLFNVEYIQLDARSKYTNIVKNIDRLSDLNEKYTKPFSRELIACAERHCRYTLKSLKRDVPAPIIDSIQDCNSNDLWAKYSPITGRLYTPYTQMSKDKRPAYLEYNAVHIDLHASHIVILANLLEDFIPDNSFSNFVLNCKTDLYIAIRDCIDDGVNLSRKEVKELCYKMIFGGDTRRLRGFEDLKEFVGSIQGSSVRDYYEQYARAGKSQLYYSRKNLPMLLSQTEASLMMEVWTELSIAGIRYQPVHDAAHVESGRADEALQIMQRVVNSHGWKNLLFSTSIEPQIVIDELLRDEPAVARVVNSRARSMIRYK